MNSIYQVSGSKPTYRIYNESERIQLLNRLGILDSSCEDSYDYVTKVASKSFGMPVALVTFLDRNRQWFKAKIGLDFVSIPRDQAFCNYTIQNDGVTVIADATKDDRFRNNPLVVDDPKIVFYAGAPIKFKNGIHVGTVCVMDFKPRQFSASQRTILGALSSQVSTLLHTRQLNPQLHESYEHIRKLERILPVCSWCKDIRNPDDSWVSVETYLMSNNDLEISHSICPLCTEKMDKDITGFY